MTQLAVAAVAIGNETVAARLGQQHVGEIFGTHGRFLCLHVGGADDTGHHLARKFGFGGTVEGGRVVALKFKVATHVKGGTGVLGDVAHALLNQVQHLQTEGAHRALQLTTVGDDIGGLAGMDHGDRDDTGINRFLVAADDGLKCLHQLAGDRHRVEPVVGQGGVPALAVNGDLELVARRHDRPRAGGEFAYFIARPVVHAKHRLHREFVKQTVLDHLARAAATFFSGLKDEVHGAIKISVFRQVLGCRQQHGGVAVMAAGVHLAGMLAGVAESVELLHRQRIHVGAQANGTRRGTALDDAHNTRGAHAAVQRNAPPGQLAGHQVSGAGLFKTQLGVGVNVAAKAGNTGCLGHDGINNFHGVSCAQVYNQAKIAAHFDAKPMNPISASLTDPTAKLVIGACPHDCPDTCSMLTTVAGGIAIKVQGNPDHPHTDGALCTKVSRYPERTYHPERILYPLKRVGVKGAGQFERVSWDAALHDIAARLKAIAGRGPDAAQAILPYSYAGTMGLVQGDSMSMRFFHKLGASLLDRTICSSAGGEALVQTLGAKVGMRVEFFAESKLILIWGSNSIASNLHFWRYAQTAKRNGAKLICIDPRKTETADKCHAHIALLPGTDGALALALMHQLITHDWLDHDYLAQYTLGWDALRRRALQWPPKRAALVCGIPATQISDLARDYGACVASRAPAAIRMNYGMQRVHGGGNAVRLIACLPALTGAWRHRGGGVLLSSSGAFPINKTALQRPDLLAGKTPRTLNMSTVGDVLLRPTSPDFGPAIEALIVYNSNPVAIAPESAKVVQGFARDDLFTVVLEHFQTDTADYADYLLPATTQLEHWDVHASYGHTDVLLNRPAITAQGEAKPNTQIFRELAQKMGYLEPCFADDDAALCRMAYGDAVDFDELLEKGFASLATAEAPFAQGNFPTPSGKCEFVSARLAAQGLDGLADHVPNHEAFNTAPRYPLAMISPPARNFLNSTFVNVKSLRDIEGEPLLEMHATDSAARGIQSGQIVRVFNPRGSYRCMVHVSPRARPGVVNGLGVWWRKLGLDGTNVNQLTSQRLTDLGRAPTFYDCLVQVEPE